MEQDSSSTDPTVRGQIQEESVQVGLRMQQFGSLLLELGRTILTLRMGQSPVSFCWFWIILVYTVIQNCDLKLYHRIFLLLQAESVINAGPAVYISPMGPNPLMVQVSAVSC